MREARSASPNRPTAVVTAVLLCAAGGLAGAAPARAGLPSPLRLHREVHEHVHDVLSHLVRVPERIHREHARHLEVFFGGREYYRPHRHEHAIYRFPVYLEGGVVDYRPYAYCDGAIFGAVSYRPRLWVEWGYESHGSWCDHHHGYYPTSHSCFRPRRVVRYYDDYRHDRYRHDRYRHDRYDRYRDHDRHGDRWDRGRRGHDRWDRDRHDRGRGRGRGHDRHGRH